MLKVAEKSNQESKACVALTQYISLLFESIFTRLFNLHILHVKLQL